MDFKAQVEKLEGATNWSKWRRQVELLLRHNEVFEIVNGESFEPAPPQETSETAVRNHTKSLKAFKKNDALAQLILVSSLNSTNLDLTATCCSSKAIWDKLVSVYEQSSGQKVDRLLEQFFTVEKNSSEDIATYVARLQKDFCELNGELKRLVNTELPEILLMSRIMSTLPKEYFEFKSVWESVPLEERSLNKLTERLRLIEMRLPGRDGENGSESSALLTRKKSERKAEKPAEKPKIRCYKCHQMGSHIAKNCPKKKQNGGSEVSGEAYLCVKDGTVGDGRWLADSGASVHMTSNKNFFVTYEKFDLPKKLFVGNNETILAYGHGEINVEMKTPKKKWVANHLQDVWYVPKVSKNLFSISQTVSKGFTFEVNQHGCKFSKDGKVTLTGRKTANGLYELNMRVVRPQVASEVHVVCEEETLQLWHERLCHQNKRHVVKVLKKYGVELNADDELCVGCMFGKQHRASYTSRPNRPTVVGEQINVDVCGPMQEDSLGGSRYFVCFKDDYSKFRRVFFIKTKNEVIACLKTFLNEAKNAGHVIQEILCDGGGEFDNLAMKTLLNEKAIRLRVCMPYTPEQNGASERENRTVVEEARSMLYAKNYLPISLWAEAVDTTVYVLNRTGEGKEDRTPYELWFKKERAGIDHLKIFGTKCYVHVPKPKRRKWDKKSVSGYFVGYCHEKDGYRIWLKDENKVLRSKDVVFDKESIFKDFIEPRKTDDVFKSTEKEIVEFKVKKTVNTPQVCQLEAVASTSGAHCSTTLSAETSQTNFLREEELDDKENLNSENSDMSNGEETEDPVHQARRKTHMPSYLKDYVMIAEIDEPDSFESAILSDDKVQWKRAMDEELNSLAENKTWDLVDLPPGKKVIGCRWVLRIKRKPDGSIDRYKARLVAKGYAQKYGIDYEETFSPVARYDTVRTILSVAAAENLKLGQFDVKTAFLYGYLSEEVYMNQPQGFDDQTGRVCKLNRSLYGLKQSPRCWNHRLIDFMKKEDFMQSTADPCVFVRERGEEKLIIAVYVDDGLIVSRRTKDIEDFLNSLKMEFKITVGTLDSFLGMQISCYENGDIFVNQAGYTKKMLEKFRMADTNPVSTPAMTEGLIESKPVQHIPYREAVGSLMYLSVATRPDITYALSVASESLEKPTDANWKSVKRIFKYLKGTINMGLLYKASCKPGVLEAYSDADYAGDIGTRRSRTGAVCKHSGGAITWLSKKQRSIVLSTTEAEYVAASECTKEVIWLSRLISEISVLRNAPKLLIDNASAVKLIKNPEFHKRSKHIDIRYHFIREKYSDKKIVVDHIEGENQVADSLTKSLPKHRFEKLRDMLGLYNVFQRKC